MSDSEGNSVVEVAGLSAWVATCFSAYSWCCSIVIWKMSLL